MRVSRKVVIEGNILVKDHYQVFDGRRRWAAGVLRRSVTVQQTGEKHDRKKVSFRVQHAEITWCRQN